MYSKLFVSILIVTSGFILALGQTPEAKKEKAEQAFAFTFDGDGGYLGIQTQDVSKENFAKLGLRDVRGVAVEKVIEGSPAAAAGLQAGDVIIRFNGDDVTGARQLARFISDVAPDHQVKMTVLRGGSEQEVTATLGKHPMPKFADGNFAFSMPDMKDLPALKNMPDFKELPQFKEFPDMKAFPKGDMPRVFNLPNGEGEGFVWRGGASRQIGVGLTPLGKQLATHFGVDAGVMISEVRENSPAAKAGLKAGDIIVEINGKAVKGEIDLVRAINEKQEGDVTLTIVRDKNRQTVSVTPETSKDGGFVFQTNDENGAMTPAPIRSFKMAPPMAPTPMTAPMPTAAPMPMTSPAPVTLWRPGRII